MQITNEFWDFIEANIPEHEKREDVLLQSKLQLYIDGNGPAIKGIDMDTAIAIRNQIVFALGFEAINRFVNSLPVVISSKELLHEYAWNIARIAYMAGDSGFRPSPDSCETYSSIISWANEFSMLHKDTDWTRHDYNDCMHEYIQSKLPRTVTERKQFGIAYIDRATLKNNGYDTTNIQDRDIDEIAGLMAESYYQSGNFSKDLQLAGENIGLMRTAFCPRCGYEVVHYNEENGMYICCSCEQTWNDDIYVLVEYPEDTGWFHIEGIGYPSTDADDSNAIYVPQYEYIRHCGKDPDPRKCFKPVRWPESQSYMPEVPGNTTTVINELINDRQGLNDFGPAAYWVALYNIENK